MSRLVMLLLAWVLPALPETLAIVNARLVPVTAPPVEKATLLIRDGRIAAMGVRVNIPGGTRRIDAAGLAVYPGWIDAFSTVGLSEIPAIPATVDLSETGTFNPAAQAWVAVNPHSEVIRVTRANGITAALAAPRGGRISGTASVVNLFGEYPTYMAILKQAGLVLQLPSLYGARSAAGTGARETEEARRKRIVGELAEVKRYFEEARAYSEMRVRGGAANDTMLEAMLPYVRGERPVIAVANHFREIRDAIALADEFRLKLLIAGGSDAWKVASLLQSKNVGVLYAGVHALPASANDAYDTGFAAPEALRKAGVRFALISRSASTAYELAWQAASAMAFGLTPEDALKAITIWPAELLGVDKEIGSIEVGKIANLLISRGDPLDVRSEIRHVLISGREVPLQSRHTDLYQRFRQIPSLVR